MDRAERNRLKGVINDVTCWANRGSDLATRRQQLVSEGTQAEAELVRRVRPCKVGGEVLWSILALTPTDSRILTAIARVRAMPILSAEGEQAIAELNGDSIGRAVTEVTPLFGAGRLFGRKTRKEAALSAAEVLRELHTRVERSNVMAEVERLDGWDPSSVPSVEVPEVLSSAVGVSAKLGDLAEVFARDVLAATDRSIRSIERALHREIEFRQAVAVAAKSVREAESRRLLAEMPVERLKDATSGRLRVGALAGAGITNVLEVIDRGSRIRALPGVGDKTGDRMLGAARAIWQSTLDEMPVRIDIKNRWNSSTELLSALHAWDAARSVMSARSDLVAADSLKPIMQSLEPDTSHIVLAPQSRSVAQMHEASSTVRRRASLLLAGTDRSVDVWEDFLARPADYYAMLSELGLLADDEKKGQSDLPSEILEAVRDLKLETVHLKASLRGYQSFGARFAIVQGKVVIGDEMGLGKTVESLAVLTHLRAKGSRHFLVVCPAAVVTNWVREVSTKSDLRAYRLHGVSRERSLTSWVRNGGVAVTTYDSLRWLDGQIPERAKPACLVLDEAHYIKNPDALRTYRARALIHDCERSILLTGTPLENRTEEFRNLVGYLRPDLAVSATEFAPRQFRKQVAPAYLRRNQEDVLTELPELVEVNEWMPLSPTDEHYYRAAVAEGNFMAMRQAALRAGMKSEKMQRLLDIVEEAEANARKVLIFSHFRDALDDVASVLPGKVFGPLTGAVPAAKRQSMVDEFSKAPHGAVLVAQIVAGGVGLNIQAASVVVICEPQLKPTTEWQAIARSRRMGQLESVQVHRLLSEEGVDQRITELLAKKSELFAEFARLSETAESAPEAFDISDADVAREIVAAERERLLS